MIINFNKTRFNQKYVVKIKEAYEYAIKYLKVPCKDLEVNIDFVSTRRIKELNNNFRNIDKITDVLSFPNLLKEGVKDEQVIVDVLTKENFKNEINPENDCMFLGDICICKKRVYKQSKEYGTTKLREMVYMSVHGLLHLLGYDHMNEHDKKNMRSMEEKIMKHINLEMK